MSNPTTKWNSFISFLSQHKAESESSLRRTLLPKENASNRLRI